MGYNTQYTLHISDENVISGVFCHPIDGSTLAEIFFDETQDAETDTIKWYDHEIDMKNVSRAFPTVLFTLRGEGESSGDIWRKYFLNGKMQHAPARIEFDSFDTAKLT